MIPIHEVDRLLRKGYAPKIIKDIRSGDILAIHMEKKSESGTGTFRIRFSAATFRQSTLRAMAAAIENDLTKRGNDEKQNKESRGSEKP